MLSLLDVLALCSNSVTWSRSARDALVQTHKQSVIITSCSVSFRLHYICHLMLGNVVVAPASRVRLPRATRGALLHLRNGILVGRKNGPTNSSVWKCVPKTEPKASYRTVRYEYAYRYTPNIYMYVCVYMHACMHSIYEYVCVYSIWV